VQYPLTMSASLKARTANALLWSFVQEVIGRGLQLGVGILLARMLSPIDFGLVAMLSIFIAVAQALVQGGLGSALIQRSELTEAHKSSAFYLNVVVGVFFAATLWLAASGIASFYHKPLLRDMIRVLALLPLLNGFCVVQDALLIRHLEFKKQTLMLVASTGAYGLTGVVLAWRGFGVWSLVYPLVSEAFIRTALLWWFSRWRPRWQFSRKAVGEMIAFGWGMLASALMSTVFDNLYSVIMGKCFSSAELGYFNRAQTLQANASQLLGTIANRVVFPVFSSLQEDPARFRSGLRNAMTTIAFVQFPMLVGLAVVAKPLVLIVFTEKWSFSIPYLQLLAIAGLFYPVHMLNLNVLASLGRSDLFFRLNVLKLLIYVLNALVTFRWGMTAMIWGLIAYNLPAYYLNSYYTGKLIGYTVGNQLKDLCPYLAASVLMGLVVTVFASFLPPINFLQLGFKIGFGVLVYVLICCAFRVSALGELVNLVWRRSAVVAVF
jgi:teichuronic acid exporter